MLFHGRDKNGNNTGDPALITDIILSREFGEYEQEYECH